MVRGRAAEFVIGRSHERLRVGAEQHRGGGAPDHAVQLGVAAVAEAEGPLGAVAFAGDENLAACWAGSAHAKGVARDEVCMDPLLLRKRDNGQPRKTFLGKEK